MPCFHPLTGYQLRHPGPTGKRPIVFSPNHPAEKTLLMLPCGRCVGCRLDRAKGWALRCAHEALQWPYSSFLTLTYNKENLPWDGSLDHTHFQDFMKRLRRHLEYHHGITRIAYYMCGEYGEKFSRPHYHAIIFGWDFHPDREVLSKKRGNTLYQSETLNKLWGKGFASIGAVTYQSAGYCARYSMKKLTGEPAKEHYKRVDPETGEVFFIEPEYNKMSLRPAIGKGFFEAYSDDIYPDDFCLVEGKKVRSPRYYDRLLERSNPELLERVKTNRKAHAEKYAHNSTRERRKVREICLESKLTRLKREIEA